jgi:hypothetical protein
MIVDETLVWKQVHDLTIARWIGTKEKQLTKINLGTKENVQQVKVNSALESVITDRLIELLKEFKNVIFLDIQRLEGYSTRDCSTLD